MNSTLTTNAVNLSAYSKSFPSEIEFFPFLNIIIIYGTKNIYIIHWFSEFFSPRVSEAMGSHVLFNKDMSIHDNSKRWAAITTLQI